MTLKAEEILEGVLNGSRIGMDQAVRLYAEAPTHLLASFADRLRRAKCKDPDVVTWQIDRNVNITNVCRTGCRFCTFHCPPHRKDLAYVTTLDQYIQKIDEMYELGGDQLLLQGGMHPDLGIDFYENLFTELKKRYPKLRLNALGAPEIVHIARISSLSTAETLKRLHAAGLDTLPGAGAEILVDRVRRIVSPAKATAEEWLRVMHEAHELDIPTTATMMYGHAETPEERIEHLFRIRSVQDAVPASHRGFTAFIPWIYRSSGSRLEEMGYRTRFSANGYLRLIAISRIILDNITNIQASWLTVGTQTAQMALHAGANDMGSIMIEENVVSSAGATFRLSAEGIRKAIRDAGFSPRLRDQLYNYRD